MAAITRRPSTVATPANRLTATVATVLAAVLLLAGAAGAQDYPPRAVISVATPGATITIESPNADWGPGTQVRISYEAPNGAQATRAAAVDDDGSFATELHIPEQAAPGVAEVTVSGVDADGEAQSWEPEVLVQAEESADSAADDAVAAAPNIDGTRTAQAGAAPAPSTADADTAGAAGTAGSADKAEDATAATAGLPTTGDATGLWVFATVLLLLVGTGAVMGARIIDARRKGLDH